MCINTIRGWFAPVDQKQKIADLEKQLAEALAAEEETADMLQICDVARDEDAARLDEYESRLQTLDRDLTATKAHAGVCNVLLRQANEQIDFLNTTNIELQDKLKPNFEITDGIVMTGDEIKTAIQNAFPETKFDFELLDGDFMIGTKADALKMLNWVAVQTFPYIPNRRDCDNYGMYASASVSMVFGVNMVFAFWDYQGGHFYDIIVTADDGVYILEPQSETLYDETGFVRGGAYSLVGGKIYGF